MTNCFEEQMQITCQGDIDRFIASADDNGNTEIDEELFLKLVHLRKEECNEMDERKKRKREKFSMRSEASMPSRQTSSYSSLRTSSAFFRTWLRKPYSDLIMQDGC